MVDFFHDNLAFIKTHHRFPLRGMMLYPLFAVCSTILFILSTLLVALIGDMPGRNYWILPLLLIVPGCAILAYIRSLRCSVIPTPYGTRENQQHIDQFLQSQNIPIYMHAQDSSVFYVAPNRYRSFRKVLILIADEQCILTNIHPYYDPRSFNEGRSLKATLSALKKYMGQCS